MIAVAHPLLRGEEGEAVLRVLVSGHLGPGENAAAFERPYARICQVQGVGVDTSNAGIKFHDERMITSHSQ